MKPFVDAYRQAREAGSSISKLCGEDFGGCGEACEPFAEDWEALPDTPFRLEPSDSEREGHE